jgi:hypothetical protein
MANIVQVKTAFENFFLQQGQTTADLIKQRLYGFESAKLFSQRICESDKYRASEHQMSSIIQAFQKKHTPKGNLKFLPVEIEQFHIKGDTTESPDDFEGSWLSFLQGDGVNRETWPIAKWYLDQVYLPKCQEDLEMNEIGAGIATPAVPGVAGPDGGALDGIQTIIKRHIASGRTTPLGLGAIPALDGDFVKYMEDFGKMIRTSYWSKPMSVVMSENLVRKYQTGMRDLRGRDIRSDESSLKIEFTQLSIVGVPSMNYQHDMITPCEMIWATPTENAVMLRKPIRRENMIQVERLNRELMFEMDTWLGIGFNIPELIFCNSLN